MTAKVEIARLGRRHGRHRSDVTRQLWQVFPLVPVALRHPRRTIDAFRVFEAELALHPDNIPVYERHGFTVREELHALPEAPPHVPDVEGAAGVACRRGVLPASVG